MIPALMISRCPSFVSFIAGLLILLPVNGLGQSLTPSELPAEHEGLRGTLILVGGGSIPNAVRDRFVAEIPQGGTVIILSAAAADSAKSADQASKWLSSDSPAFSCVVPDTSLDPSAHCAELNVCLQSADGVWICGGQQSRLAAAYHGTEIETRLREVLNRGGVIGGTSAGAAIMSQVMIASGSQSPTIATGFDLLPDAVVDQHFNERNRLIRSRKAIAEHPQRFGLGIDESTAVIITGRTMRVQGKGNATILLADGSDREATEMSLTNGQTADLIQLRRAARSRASGINPGEPQLGEPEVASGALVIVGGGSMPEAIVSRFLELAGGSEARIVVLPTAVSRSEAFEQKIPRFLSRAETASVRILPYSRPDEIDSDDFRQALQSATGIWFGGGRQWNFVDAYEETDAVELFRDVLRRGGVIGGSSAGATIQGEYLVRGHPLGNTVMMAEGYERGFGFLPGTAIDQHFSQRGRKPDLIPVIRKHPRMLGIGIDEGTAIVVQGTNVEVIGDHAAHFLTAGRLQNYSAEELAEPSDEVLNQVYVSVTSGTSINLGGLRP